MNSLVRNRTWTGLRPLCLLTRSVLWHCGNQGTQHRIDRLSGCEHLGNVGVEHHLAATWLGLGKTIRFRLAIIEAIFRQEVVLRTGQAIISRGFLHNLYAPVSSRAGGW